MFKNCCWCMSSEVRIDSSKDKVFTEQARDRGDGDGSVVTEGLM